MAAAARGSFQKRERSLCVGSAPFRGPPALKTDLGFCEVSEVMRNFFEKRDPDFLRRSVLTFVKRAAEPLELTAHSVKRPLGYLSKQVLSRQKGSFSVTY